MQNRLILSNWMLLIVYTVVLVLGIVAASFLLAFYWEVDSIARINPAAVDYRAYNSVELAPLSNQVVVAARRDFGFDVNIDHPNPFEDLEQDINSPTATPVLSATNTLQPIAKPSATQISSQTPVPNSDAQTPAPTTTSSATPFATNTLEPTQTTKPTKKPTTSDPKPTATPEPRPTQPPPTATTKPQPTKTPKPYPPPRPYP